MKKSILIIFGLLSLSISLSYILSYFQNTLLHSVANLIILINFYLLLPSVFVLIFFLFKKIPFTIFSVPLLYVLIPGIGWLLSFVSYKIFNVPIYNSSISESLLFQLMTNNIFVIVFNILIFIYALILYLLLNRKEYINSL